MRLVFLSAFCHDQYIEEALKLEAAGYLTKGESPDVIVRAIRAILGGATYYSAEVQSRIVVDEKGVHLASGKRTRSATLTPRELEVLRHVAQGLSKKEIAKLMHVSVSTVDAHCARLMTKLDIHDRVGLARYAIREGLSTP